MNTYTPHRAGDLIITFDVQFPSKQLSEAEGHQLQALLADKM